MTPIRERDYLVETPRRCDSWAQPEASSTIWCIHDADDGHRACTDRTGRWSWARKQAVEVTEITDQEHKEE